MMPGNWLELAACRVADPDLFFPISATGPAERDTERACAVCRTCQVRTQCLDYALATGEPDGIWGGLTGEQRRLLATPSA